MLDDTSLAQARHSRFVKRVREFSQVWGLKTEEGWVLSPTNDEESTVMPFWSDRAYAAECATEEWAEYEATAIPLENFLRYWLPGMAEDGVLVGTNWNSQLIGLEVAPMDLHAELSAADEAQLEESES